MIIVLIVLIVAIVTAFSVQNAAPVAVTFLFWQTQASLAVIIFLAAAAGAVLGVAVMSSWMIRRSLRTKRQHRAGETPSGGMDIRGGRSGQDLHEP